MSVSEKLGKSVSVCEKLGKSVWRLYAIYAVCRRQCPL